MIGNPKATENNIYKASVKWEYCVVKEFAVILNKSWSKI